MIQTLSEPLTVTTIYNHKRHKVFPASILWQNQTYKVTKVGLHYMHRIGVTLYHVFTVTTDVLSFKLQLNTDNLFWTVEQISDGLPD